MANETVPVPADAELAGKAMPSPIFGPNITDVLSGLFSRAESCLTDEELRQLGSGHAEAMNIMGNLATLSGGLAMLIGNDENSGALQSKGEFSDLLFALSGMADHARAYLEVATCADLALRCRQLKQAVVPVGVSHG